MDFSLITNNCIGTFIYRDYNVQYQSPTINLQIVPMDFIKFCLNLDYYLSLEFEEVVVDNQILNLFSQVGGKTIDFPVARLGDIILFLQHYKSFSLAKEKWLQRKKRIQKDNLFIILNLMNYQHYGQNILKIAQEFKKIQMNKVLLHNDEMLCVDDINVVCLPMIRGISWYQHISKSARNIKYYEIFNFLSWYHQNKAMKSQSNIYPITRFNTAVHRIHNHLAYKLGRALILNSKSLWGYIRMPYVLSYIKESHKKEIAEYEKKLEKNPALQPPPLESYPDYKEALKEKECFTYKLGQALIAANSAGGGALPHYLPISDSFKKCVS